MPHFVVRIIGKVVKVSHASIEQTDKGFAYWLARPFLTEDTRAKLQKAEAILIPREGFRDQEIPVFPVRTEEMFQFVRDELAGKLNVDIAIEDSEYKELALHSALLIIGGFVVTALAAPLVVNVVSEYLNRRLFNAPGSDPDKTVVRFELTIEDRVGDATRRMQVKYDGPASQFQNTMQSIVANQKNITLQDAPRIVGPETDANS